MNGYRSWGELNKRLSELLCDSLKGRITYFLTRYHKVHNSYGRASIRLDGKELVSFSWFEHHLQEDDYGRAWRSTDPEAEWKKLKAEWNESGTLGDMDFLEAVTVFLDQPIEASLQSNDYIVRVLAVLDRRTGKRTLRRLCEEGAYGNLPQWIRQFYELRFTYEGIGDHQSGRELFRLRITDPQLSYHDYSESFDIGIFSTEDEARETAEYYLNNVRGFCDYPCTYSIEKKVICGILPKDNDPCVWMVIGWDTNDDFDEINVIESECFADEAQANNALIRMKKAYPREDWAVNCLTVGKCDWQEGFVRD